MSNGVRRSRFVRRIAPSTPHFVAIAWILATSCGCNTLPVGRVDAISRPPSPGMRGTVCLLRGWRGLWSGGMDELAAELRSHGINAVVFRDEQWKAVARGIARREVGQPGHSPVVVIGFSFGADDAIRAARLMQEEGVAVDLLVTIDPVTPPPIPPNVKRAVNYYQSNGFCDIFPWLRGVAVRRDEARWSARSRSSVDDLRNYNLRDNRKDLLLPDTSHSTVMSNVPLRREIVRQVIVAITVTGEKHATTRTPGDGRRP